MDDCYTEFPYSRKEYFLIGLELFGFIGLFFFCIIAIQLVPSPDGFALPLQFLLAICAFSIFKVCQVARDMNRGCMVELKGRIQSKEIKASAKSSSWCIRIADRECRISEEQFEFCNIGEYCNIRYKKYRMDIRSFVVEKARIANPAPRLNEISIELHKAEKIYLKRKIVTVLLCKSLIRLPILMVLPILYMFVQPFQYKFLIGAFVLFAIAFVYLFKLSYKWRDAFHSKEKMLVCLRITDKFVSGINFELDATLFNFKYYYVVMDNYRIPVNRRTYTEINVGDLVHFHYVKGPFPIPLIIYVENGGCYPFWNLPRYQVSQMTKRPKSHNLYK